MASLAPNLARADAPAAGAPLRTLVYHFAESGNGFGPGSDATWIGSTSLESGGGTGKINVTVLAATQDGGLVVDISETVDRVLLPLQTIRCAIYGATMDVICDQNTGVTTVERVLLSFLGRSFYDSARLDAKQGWQSSPAYERGPLTVTNALTVAGTNGDRLTLDYLHKEQAAGFSATTNGTVHYDAAMNILDSGNFEIAVIKGSESSHSQIALDILSDSMATAAPQANPSPR